VSRRRTDDATDSGDRTTVVEYTDFLIEESEALGHEVAHVGQVEESERNADKCVDDRYNTTPPSLGSHVPVTSHTHTHTPYSNKLDNP